MSELLAASGVGGLPGVGGGGLFWWVILPYAALLTFVIGHIWRYRYDQFGWTSRSTELQERRALKWGSPLFHYGAFAAIGGHILGILVPESATRALGIPEVVYRQFAAIAGTVAAVAVIVGVLILAGRRLFVARVRSTTSPVDWVALILLAIIIGLGIAETVGVELLGSHYNYRTTVSPWFRSLFSGAPDARAAMSAPLLFQVHVICAWVLIGVWPFSRLVHGSYPYFYLWRPFVVYRRRVPSRPNEPGTSGRRWRRIGTPY
ncbi:MAG: respiratory nitrate reductase subunit gamma [Acidimicrobiales bacterium]